MKNKIFSVFIITIILLNTSSMAIYTTLPVWSENGNTSEVNADSVSLELESESAILIEQTTGKILYEKNSHDKLRPASVTNGSSRSWRYYFRNTNTM